VHLIFENNLLWFVALLKCGIFYFNCDLKIENQLNSTLSAVFVGEIWQILNVVMIDFIVLVTDFALFYLKRIFFCFS
jgi:hypothetical protein